MAALDDLSAAERDRRLQIANRLKAARQLAGYMKGGRAIALPIEELITFPDIKKNAISKNRLEDLEQMKVDGRPMELKAIATALALPEDWFAVDGGVPLNQPIADLLQAIASDARERRREREEAAEGSGEASRLPAAEEGGAG